MLKEGTIVYYIEGDRIYDGAVMDMIEKVDHYLFSIDDYGSCEGLYVIASDQIGLTVFLNKQDAQKHILEFNEEIDSENYC